MAKSLTIDILVSKRRGFWIAFTFAFIILWLSYWVLPQRRFDQFAEALSAWVAKRWFKMEVK